MIRRERLVRGLELALLGLVAGLYFQGAINTTIGLTEEGQIVYPSWRVAEGRLPYVDFQQLYGPSVFFLNGVLFRLFGPDLQVTRLSLVVLKSLVAVLLYAVARRLASRAVALLTWAMLVAVWGVPVWIFNTPYASYYGTALCLGGLLVLSGAPGGRALRAFVTGLCFGVAATFKQTQGIFAFLALALFVVFATPADEGPPRASGARRVVGALRVCLLVALFGFALAYVRVHLASPTVVAVLAPLALSVLALVGRELVVRPWGPGELGGLGTLAPAALGMSLPAAAYAAFYWSRGALGALVYNTLVGLPERIRWYVPFPPLAGRTVLFAATVVSSLGTLVAWRRWEMARNRPATWTLVAACLLLILSAGAFGARIGVRDGLVPYVLQGGLQGDVLGVLPWLPFFLLVTAVPSLIGERRDVRAGLFFFFAVGAVLQLYPAADLAHALMMLPAFLPLLAHGVARLGTGGSRSLRTGVAGVVLLWALACSFPFAYFRLRSAPHQPAPDLAFSRATGVWGAGPNAAETAALVRYLSTPARRAQGLLVLTDEQLIYFLAGIPSALERQEFALYLLAANALATSDARDLLGEEGMLRVLQTSRPLIVDSPQSAAGARFLDIFPAIARFIESTYRPTATFGGYRVLAPSSSDG